MRNHCLRLAAWLAFKSFGIKEPDGQWIFSDSYKPPTDDISQTHIVVQKHSIVMYEYSVDRRGDCYETEAHSFRDFVWKCSKQRIGLLTTYYVANQSFDSLTRKGEKLSDEEFWQLRNDFEREQNDRLDRFLNSMRFMAIEKLWSLCA